MSAASHVEAPAADAYLCPGCNVNAPWEHRCHSDGDGEPCYCDMCEGRMCVCIECRIGPALAAASRAIDALEAHLGDDTPLPDDVQPIGLYCGCTSCVVREALNAALPHLLPKPHA